MRAHEHRCFGSRTSLVIVGLLLGLGAGACQRTALVSEGTRSVRVVGKEPASAAPQRTALIVGNARYRQGPLRNPVNDATAVATKMRGLGFDVQLIADGTQEQMKRGLAAFGERLKGRKGVALFYYSGHGIQINGRNYLVPVDAPMESEAMVDVEGVSVDSVLAAMDAAKTQVNVLILDACRNNPFAHSFRSLGQGLAFMDAPSGTLIAYATAPGRVAFDGAGKNGTYSAALLRHLTVPGLTIEQILKRTGGEVEDETGGQQTPWLASSLRGELVLSGSVQPAPGGAAPVPAAAPQPQSSEMVDVPAGTFIAGCEHATDQTCRQNPEAFPALRNVELPAFRIDRTEVTVADYHRCVEAKACAAEELDAELVDRCVLPAVSSSCNWKLASRTEHPMNCVSWHQARDYCHWVGKRLPTDDEWEKAARGGDGRRYPWGNDEGLAAGFGNVADLALKRRRDKDNEDDAAWRFWPDYDDGYVETAPVGSFPAGASPYGALDMLGNVWEWTLEGSARGGDWFTGPRTSMTGSTWFSGQKHTDMSRSAAMFYRSQPDPSLRSRFGGFRCVDAVAAKEPAFASKPFRRPSADFVRERKQALDASLSSDARPRVEIAAEVSGRDCVIFLPGEGCAHDWVQAVVGRESPRLAACLDQELADGVTGSLDDAGELHIADDGSVIGDWQSFRCETTPKGSAGVADCAPAVRSRLQQCLAPLVRPLSFGPACQPGRVIVRFHMDR
jgi:formylglycine-generating enzyme required for sulfatase activity